MDSEQPLPRVVSAKQVWKEAEGSEEVVFSHIAIVAFVGDTPYHGTTTETGPNRDKEAILRSLKPIPREDIYPPYSSHLTRAPEVYIKKPSLTLYSPDDGQGIADRLLNEAEVYETLRKHPHPALGQSLGCIVADDGRITGLALVKYEDKDLHDRAFDSESFGEKQRDHCIKTLKDAVQHLHGLGLAHNDLTPRNVMFKHDGEPVLIDFDTCLPIGTKLTKGGRVGEWESGIPVAIYETSSVDCDNAGIEQIGIWLKKTYDEDKSKNDAKKEEGNLPGGTLEGASAKGNEECIQ